MMIEPLESRIAPAVVVSATTVTFTDVDGDDVTVKISKGSFDPAGSELVFNNAFGSTGPQQLQKLDLSSVEFAGTNVTITAKRSVTNGGDGFVNVGFIDARDGDNVDLGAVTVDGDLSGLDAGDGDGVGLAVKALTAQSLGIFGSLTHGGLGDTNVTVVGDLGPTKIKTDVRSGFQLTGSGNIVSLTVGGSVFGGAGFQSGTVEITGSLGPVKIGGSLVGGSGNLSGSISANGKIASITIGGSVIGGSALESASIDAGGDIGSVKIGRDLRGGGPAADAGRIVSSGGNIKSITIGGAVLGSSGDYTAFGAQVFAGGTIGSITVLGDVRAAAGDGSGSFKADSIDKVSILGNVIGGSGLNTAQIVAQSGSLGTVSIRGSFEAGSGVGASQITASGAIKSVSIGGSWLRSGGGDSTISATGSGGIGTLKISGDLTSAGGLTAVTAASGDIGSIFVGGDVVGGAAGNPIFFAGNALKTIDIKGSVVGTANFPVRFTAQSITAASTLTLGKVSIGRSATFLIIAGTDADGDIGSVTIGGDFVASRIAVGTAAGADNRFGTSDDTFLGGGVAEKLATLGSLTIKGMAYGTPDSVSNTDSFRVLAERIGKVKVGDTALPLAAGADDLQLGFLSDLRVVDLN